jgi:hypothetical protein
MYFLFFPDFLTLCVLLWFTFSLFSLTFLSFLFLPFHLSPLERSPLFRFSRPWSGAPTGRGFSLNYSSSACPSQCNWQNNNGYCWQGLCQCTGGWQGIACDQRTKLFLFPVSCFPFYCLLPLPTFLPPFPPVLSSLPLLRYFPSLQQSVRMIVVAQIEGFANTNGVNVMLVFTAETV